MTDVYTPAPPPGPAVFPPPGAAPARPRKPWSRTRMAAAGTAVFVAGGGLIGLLTAGGVDTSTPRGAVEAVIHAQQDGDFALAFSLLCSDQRDSYGSLHGYEQEVAAGGSPLTAGMSADVTDVAYAGDGDYRVTVQFARFGAHIDVDVSVVSEHGAYRVCGASEND